MSRSGSPSLKLNAGKKPNPCLPGTPSTKTKGSEAQMNLPIPYSPEEAKRHEIAKRSLNKLGTPTGPSSVRLNSIII